MAIQGLGYTKTTWAFEERPVSSAKLNQWDDRIEGALEVAFYLLSQFAGGNDGVLRGAGSPGLMVESTDTPGLSVQVLPGYAMISQFPYRLSAVTETGTFALPATLNRIDLVQASLSTWSVSIKQGTESATPVAPAPDANHLPLAEIVLRPGMSLVKDVDDSVNGYIVDVRPFL